MEDHLHRALSDAHDQGKKIRFKKDGVWSEPGYISGGLKGRFDYPQDGVVIEVRDSSGIVIKKEILFYSDNITEIEGVD